MNECCFSKNCCDAAAAAAAALNRSVKDNKEDGLRWMPAEPDVLKLSVLN